MNHINKLETENKLMKEWLADLDRYVNSSKFGTNVMINKQDINLRLGELRSKFFHEGLTLDTNETQKS